MELQISDRENIVIGVIYNEDHDKILLSRRRIDSHQGGLWELPGGKINPGELPTRALGRELAEELGIIIGNTHPLTMIEHDYADKAITIRVIVVDSWSGGLHGKEGQLVEWVRVDDLPSRPMPAANSHLIRLISLPSLYLITPDKTDYDQKFFLRTRDFLKHGLGMLQFRTKSPDVSGHQYVVRKLVEECEKYSSKLIYNGTAEQAEHLGAHGVHLNSDRLMKLQKRPLGEDKWVVASCHNRQELQHAVKTGVDFCVLSPVHASSSHPLQDGIGWNQFQSITNESCLPIYALGGVKVEELAVARNHGAHGVAMISGIWNDGDALKSIQKMSVL